MEERPAHSPSVREIAGIVLLSALALILRLRGIDFLLPVLPLSDSFPIAQQIDSLRGKSWTEGFVRELSPYPQLLGNVTSLLPEPPDVPPGPAPTLEDHLRLASEPYRQIRIVAAVLSVLIVPGTWLLARRFLSPGAALLAGALVATSLMHVNFAVQEKPHGPLSGVVAFAVLAGIRLRRKGDVLGYVLAGAAIGLAVATLHSGVATLFVLPAAVVLRERRAGRASVLWAITSAALIVLFARFSYPALFQPDTQQIRMFETEAGRDVLEIPGGNEIYLPLMRGHGFLVVLAGLWSNDPLLFVAVAFGLIAAVWTVVRDRRGLDRRLVKDLVVVLSFALPYLGVIGLFDNTQERYVLPLLPFFACLGAFGLARSFEALTSRASGAAARVLAPALSLAVLAFAFVPAWHLGEIRTAPDTFARTARYLEEHAQPSVDRILIPSALDLPLLHGATALAENSQYSGVSNWVRYQLRVPPELFTGPRYEVLIAPGPRAETMAALQSDPVGYFQKHGARWVVLPVAPYFDSSRRALLEKGELAFRIAPEAEDRGGHTLFTYMHGHNEHPWRSPFFASVMAMGAVGSTLEIYRLK